MINYMSNGKVIITHLIAGFKKKISFYNMSCSPGTYTGRKNKIKVNYNCLIRRNLTLKHSRFPYIEIC